MSNQIYPSGSTIANAPSIINYEDMLSTQMSQIEKELINIALIPSDDIEIIEIEKKFPTIQQLRPELEAELDKNISECLRSYNSNYKFISKKYQSYSSKYLTDKKKQLQYNVSKKIESQEYEISDSNQQQLQNNNNNESDYDSFNNEHFNLLDTLNKENEQLRNKPRPLSLFKFYPVQQQNDLINVEFQMMPVPPAEQPCTKILVKCTQLKFELEIEPLWATMSLYDLKEKRKLSENFAFDLNTESIKHMLNTHQTHQDVSTTAKSCLFNITNPTPDIFLVIRIEKVLQQGDISECAESYVRVQSISQIEKLQLNASQFCDRLGKFRMPFVWTAVNIMNILNSAKNDSSEQKSTSLDRRSVKSNDSSSATTTTINYDTDETPASEEDFLTAASKPSVLKNAYENFKKQSTSSKCTKTNSFRSMNETNNLTRFKPIGITVNTFFKQENDKLSDEDLFKFLADLKKPTNLIKKLKCVPGHLKMEFSPFDHDFYDNDLASIYPNYFYLTPELELIKQANLSSSLEQQQQQERKQNHYHQPLVMHNHLLPVKDILEFTGRSVFTPNYIYRNILYIYPLSISLASANLIRGTASTNLNPAINQQSSSARNIAIKINLMKGEEEHCALPVIFAKSSSTLEYHKEVYVNVVYHNKTPQYHDEIKIKLPAILNESNVNYHLLFTFYHVSCQSNKDSNQLESIIGYSWLPLQQKFQFETSNDQTTSTTNNIDSQQQQQQTQQQKISSDNHCTMVKNGTYTLPICSEKLPVGYSNLNYSNYSNNENIEQTATTNENEENESSIPNNNSDNHNHNTILNNLPTINSNNNLISLTKSFFDIRLNLISTIHTQDVYLERFIRITNQQTNNIDANILKRTIQDLHLADSDALVKFVFILMDKLFHLSVQINCLSIYCLEAISKIILKINGLLSSQQDSHKRNRILVQYVKYACNLPLDFIETQCLFHEHLIQELINILKNKNNTSRDLLIQTMWFYLEILFKALTFYLNRATNHFKMYRTKQQIKQHSFNLFCTKFLSQKFLNDLECLIQLLISELIDYKNKDDSKDTLLNCALTFFINDLLSLIDRNFIFHRLIDLYFKETNKMLNHLNNLLTETKNILNLRFKQIHSMQLDFLRIISSNEHFLALNLPIFPNLLEQQQQQQQQRSRLVIETNEYFSIHYLIGLVLKQTFKSIHSAIPCIQFKAIQVIRNLFEANDLDPRLDTYKSRTHIAFMYMPFMNLFIHFMPLMIKKQQSQQRYKQQDIFSNKENNGGCCLNSKKNDFDLLNDVLSEPELDLSNESLAGDFEDCDLFDCANDLDNLTENTTDIDLESMNIYETENFIDGFVLDNQQQQQQQVVVESKNFLSKNSIQRKSQRIKPTISTSSVNSSSVKIIQKQHLTNNKYACCDFYNFKIDESDTGLLNTESTQDLLICFLWILKNIGYELLFKIWSRWSLIRLKKVLALIDLCISHFEYKSSVWSDLSKELKKTASQISTSTASIKNLLNKNNKFINSNKAKINDLILNNKNNNNNNNMNKSEFIKRAKYTNFDKLSIFDIINDSKIMDSNMSDHDRTILESNLSTECNLILLDSIEIIIEVIQHQNSLPSLNVFKSFINKTETSTHLSHHNLLKSVMKVILNMLNIQPSTRTLPNLFSLQRDFVSKFSDLLFESDTDYCSDMCTLLLRHCTSQLNAVRVQASASMYFLMRQNFDIGNNFARVKQQLTMSLSSLVTGITSNNNNELNKISADSFNTYNIAALKSSLKTILINADSDSELIESTFPCQVKDLIINLNTILSDTIKMKDYSDDHDMILDLMHRIANCYANSPDMRLIWLQNMAQKHLERQNLVEAGQCLVHAAALIAEYLSMIENKSYLPVGCASFKNVSINVLEESAISDDVVVHSSLDGVCTGKYFTETGLIGLIEQAAVFLVHSQNYEASNQLYKILIPIYEYHRDIKKLSQVHSKLHDCFNKILINGSRRLFGTYFRVGFYGHSFNELNGEEFVYKEPGITKLAEIAHRLENYYTEKFGDDIKLEIMKDSNNVDKKQLDLVRKAYIQITYVEPYFDRWESQKCVTYFEKNYSLKRFIYSTPFTLEGKAHGALNDQYKRKTILTTERAFPYVKIRIPVIDKQQIILTPVEVAIEDLQKKIDELRNAIYQEPSDPKILQMVLQGCVGTTVNQGPLEMALTFLQPTSIDAINEHHNKLRLCFKEFSRRCLEALKKNKLLIGPDQYEYQREMERNYNEFSSKIDPLIENKLFKNL